MIETARLRLRPGCQRDVPALLAALNDWSVAQWLIRPPYPYGVDDAAAFLRWTQAGVPGSFTGRYAIADRGSDLLLGCLTLEPDGEQAELGYWLAPAAWGRGLATEAAQAALRAGWQHLPVHRVIAVADPANSASIGVLRRCGFHPFGRRTRSEPTRRGTTEALLFGLPRPPET
jgi:RimJ/RimL family protein N-acetyltransferase